MSMVITVKHVLKATCIKQSPVFTGQFSGLIKDKKCKFACDKEASLKQPG